ncbi:MAG: hypothetical protein E7652_03480 [Ruminococcaceae bacterium]|nr:hypothetical protein [Oscillospiraceae bacterium]
MTTILYSYDKDDNMLKKRIIFADGGEETVYYDNSDEKNEVVKFYVPDSIDSVGEFLVTSHSKTDSFGRKAFDELQHSTGTLNRRFTYLEGEVTYEHRENDRFKSLPTTQLVKEIVISSARLTEADRILSYEYDGEERITKVTDSAEGVTEYTYDALGQLLTETFTDLSGVSTVINTMTYDNYGNITTKNGKVYTYDSTWKDLLTSYDGQSIVYDAQGNPTTYLGHTLTWEKGRQLKSFDNIAYTYNSSGMRTSKTVNGVKHEYLYDGSKLIRESWGDNTLIPLYDNEDSVCGIKYNGESYFFVKNLQGDVISIIDIYGDTKVEYTYDAWGKCSIPFDSSNILIGDINPFRYRGYYYDDETNLYYLQSRYYNPEVGRFVNRDEICLTLLNNTSVASNLFCYCTNTPITMIDYNGYYSSTLVISASITTLLSGKLSSLMTGISASMASLKIAISTSWIIALCVAAAAIAITGIIYTVNKLKSLSSSAQSVVSSTKSKVKSGGLNPNKLKNYTVYVIVYKNTTDVVYVGMTKNYTARKNKHTSKKFPKTKYTMMPIATGLSKSQARALEQTLITAYTLDTLENMINSISPKKWSKFKTEFNQMTSLVQSWVDPE